MSRADYLEGVADGWRAAATVVAKSAKHAPDPDVLETMALALLDCADSLDPKEARNDD